MADLKPGKKSTEWWTVVGVILFAAAKAFNIIPQDATVETVTQQGSQAIPILVNGILDIAKQNGSILIAAGIAWAYLKRRYSLKARQQTSQEPKK